MRPGERIIAGRRNQLVTISNLDVVVAPGHGEVPLLVDRQGIGGKHAGDAGRTLESDLGLVAKRTGTGDASAGRQSTELAVLAEANPTLVVGRTNNELVALAHQIAGKCQLPRQTVIVLQRRRSVKQARASGLVSTTIAQPERGVEVVIRIPVQRPGADAPVVGVAAKQQLIVDLVTGCQIDELRDVPRDVGLGEDALIALTQKLHRRQPVANQPVVRVRVGQIDIGAGIGPAQLAKQLLHLAW